MYTENEPIKCRFLPGVVIKIHKNTFRQSQWLRETQGEWDETKTTETTMFQNFSWKNNAAWNIRN